VLQELTKKYGKQVRLVFKHRPLEIHSQAFLASQAAFCAAEQGKFWPYHDALFTSDELTPANFNTLAANLHLDEKKFSTCLASDESRLAIQKDLDEARHFGINSTPTFVINGKLFRGAPELDQFAAAIDAELKRVAGPN
jgi:protein-disulfide isomerase